MTHEQWGEIIEKADGMGEPIHPFIQEDVHNLIGPGYYTVVGGTEMTDTERLDVLEAMLSGYGNGVILRIRSQGGMGLHETSDDGEAWGAPPSDSVRAAIDDFVRRNA